MSKKIITSAVLALAVAGAVIPATSVVASAKELKTVKVGINSPSKTDQAVWNIVKKNGEKRGIKIKLITFTDFNQPNAALMRMRSNTTPSCQIGIRHTRQTCNQLVRRFWDLVACTQISTSQ